MYYDLTIFWQGFSSFSRNIYNNDFYNTYVPRWLHNRARYYLYEDKKAKVIYINVN